MSRYFHYILNIQLSIALSDILVITIKKWLTTIQYKFSIKKPTQGRLFANIFEKNINALRIVDVYVLCVNQLSYVQLYAHHE